MPGVIHMIKPGKKALVFGDLTDLHLISFILSYITDITTRIDGLWEAYKISGSLKIQTW